MNEEISPTTRRWAITTLVLAILCAGLGVVGLVTMKSSPIALTGDATYFTGLSVAQTVIALGFIVGSAGVLQGRAWGRSIVAYSAIGALVTIILMFFLQMGLKDNPAYIQALREASLKSSPQVASMPEQELNKMVALQKNVGFIVAVVISMIELAYCSLLYRHMAGEHRDGA